ncbi:hypothetical protein HYW74_01380 [Candidatus Pacearchaeota archaeon]|nr:hypothetical protein [Candidatus Pacearchaeota archaeon]
MQSNDVNQALAEHKYLLSIGRSCHVTTPEAFDDILTRDRDYAVYQEFFSSLKDFRSEVVEAYLFEDVEEPLIFNVKVRGGMTAQRVYESDEAWHEKLANTFPSFVSKEKFSRLEGELRRFWAYFHQKDPREVDVTPEIIDLYCEKYNLISLKERMMKAFNF